MMIRCGTLGVISSCTTAMYTGRVVGIASIHYATQRESVSHCLPICILTDKAEQCLVKQDIVMSENSEHESQKHISMFNHNRIGDVFIALSPVLNGWGLFTIILMTLFIGVYWWTHPHDFIALVFNSVNTVAGFLNALMWLMIIGIGGFIVNKTLKGLAETVKHFKEIFRPAPIVHAVNDNFALYSGKQILIHDHREDKSVYNYKISEIAGPPDVPALAPPVMPVPTGRQLLLDGTVEKHLREGLIILGQGSDGQLKPLKIKRCFSTLVSGLPSVGKTTTVFWIVGQLTLIGAKLWIVDPHMYFEDEDGNKSLAKELAALADSFMFPPCEGKPQDVIQRVKWMYNQLRRRQQPGYIVRADQTVIGIMDEFNSVADSIDKKLIVITHEGQDMNFAATLALVEREGRKYGLHFMLIGHKWAQQDIGGDNAVRTNATTYLCHRLNDEHQANLLLGSGQGKKVLGLSVGSYWITGPTWNAEQAKITTPEISAADLPVLLEIKRRRVPVVNQANVVESTIASDVSATVSTSYPQEQNGYSNGYNPVPPVKPMDTTNSDVELPENLRTKMLMVLELDEQNKSQNEIISMVWGADANTRQGRAAVEELRQIRAYLAVHARKTMRLTERGV